MLSGFYVPSFLCSSDLFLYTVYPILTWFTSVSNKYYCILIEIRYTRRIDIRSIMPEAIVAAS